MVVGRLLLHGAPDSPVRQPRQQTVGVRPLELCLVGPPGCPVVHRTSPVDCPGINMQKCYAGQEKLKRVWAPQTIFDAEAGKYLVYWSMKYGDGADVIYYAYANKEFTDLGRFHNPDLP